MYQELPAMRLGSPPFLEMEKKSKNGKNNPGHGK
jgi:hypothetical protein